jgi:hypothetical protein
MFALRLPTTYLCYLQYGTKTQRKLLPGLSVSETEKAGISLVSIDETKLLPSFKGNEILLNALKSLNLISQLPENEIEKHRMAKEIHRHIITLAAKKSSFERLLDTTPYFGVLGLGTYDSDIAWQESNINKAIQGLNEVMATARTKFSDSTTMLSCDAGSKRSEDLEKDTIAKMKDDCTETIAPCTLFFNDKDVKSTSEDCENLPPCSRKMH